MRRLLLLLALLLVFSSAFAQMGSGLTTQRALMPIPSWVKEGVCIVYESQSGVRSGMGAESSVSYGAGYTILIVTNVVAGRVYGIEYVILAPRGGSVSVRSSIKLMNEFGYFLYMHPKAVEDVLKDRVLYAQHGVVVEGGPIGGDLYYFAMTTQSGDEITTTAYEMTRDGIIKKASITRKNASGAEAASNTLVGVYQLELPKLTLPEVTRQNVSYSIHYSAMGVTVPLGNISYSFLSADNNIATYRASVYGRISSSSQAFGNQIFGPFYINPALLKSGDIFSIPEIGFNLSVAGYGPNGGILVVTSLSGQILAQNEYDPRTGLLLSSIFSDGMFTYYAQLSR